jgi:hemoglobin
MNGNSLYIELGGQGAVTAAVEEFYKRVMSDPELEEFFAETNMEVQKKHQVNFLTMALGGPNKYSGKDMRKAHEHLNLLDIHFDLIKKHLSDTLAHLGVPSDKIKQTMDIVEPLRNDVLNRDIN